MKNFVCKKCGHKEEAEEAPMHCEQPMEEVTEETPVEEKKDEEKKEGE